MCLREANDKQEYIEELEKYCVELRTYRRSRWTDPLRLLNGSISMPPGSAAKYWYAGAGQLIQKMIAKHKPQIVEFHHLNTAIYRRFAGGLPTILREHNVEYKVWERFAESAPGWVQRSYVRWTAPRVRQYEAEVATRFDRCVVVSEADASHLRSIAPLACVEVIPSGVDTEYFYPMTEVSEEPFTITLTGSFKWRPRHQSLLILLTKIFPRLRERIPNAKLFVVGSGVPEYLERVARDLPGVTITGTVRDVRPYIARSALLINYLETGGGIALKVLEAMAMRKPVLCNSLACEGIPMTHGEEIFVADGPENFASAAAYLLENESVRAGIAEKGYHLTLDKYSWSRLAAEFTGCYFKILGSHENKRSSAPVSVENLL